MSYRDHNYNYRKKRPRSRSGYYDRGRDSHLNQSNRGRDSQFRSGDNPIDYDRRRNNLPSPYMSPRNERYTRNDRVLPSRRSRYPNPRDNYRRIDERNQQSHRGRDIKGNINLRDYDKFQPEITLTGSKRKHESIEEDKRKSPRELSPPIEQKSKKRKLFRMNYSKDELEMRKHNFGSTLSVYDRQKFEKEFIKDRFLNLSTEEEKIYRDNPHIRQVFANHRKFIDVKRPFRQEDRYLNIDTSPKTKYQRRQGEAKTTDHWGQRKLLMSEIEFLTNYSDEEHKTLIYAGAAPGTHLNFLSELFPRFKFVLVDPAEFKAKSTDRIEVIQDFFTDEMAEEYSKLYEKSIFISDIRSCTREMNEKEKAKCIRRDMIMQQKWYNILKPKAALFKLCFPYTPGNTNYLDGLIHAPVWGGRTTTETRLVVFNEENIWPKSERNYDHTQYESMMFHFNTATRTQYYHHNFEYHETEGICHCFDCNSEILILRNYLRKIRKIEVNHEKGEIIKLSKIISRKITTTGKRTLSLESVMRFNFKGFTNNVDRNTKCYREKMGKVFMKKMIEEDRKEVQRKNEVNIERDEDLDDDRSEDF